MESIVNSNDKKYLETYQIIYNEQYKLSHECSIADLLTFSLTPEVLPRTSTVNHKLLAFVFLLEECGILVSFLNFLDT